MLSKMFKKRSNDLEIFAPITGEVVPLDQVPDPVFSQKMMGEGIAIMPTSGKVHAPIDGTVVLVSDTKHAIGIKASDDTEILIHVGLETVLLKGEGFTTLVNTGDEITVGQPLLEVDWAYIKEHATSMITPIIVTNGTDKNVEPQDAKESIAGETLLLKVSPK